MVEILIRVARLRGHGNEIFAKITTFLVVRKSIAHSIYFAGINSAI